MTAKTPQPCNASDNAGFPPEPPEAHQRADGLAPKFKVGDVVTVTNDYGVRWPGKTITGMEVVDGKTRYFYAPHDAHWYSVRDESLTLEKTGS